MTRRKRVVARIRTGSSHDLYGEVEGDLQVVYPAVAGGRVREVCLF